MCFFHFLQIVFSPLVSHLVLVPLKTRVQRLSNYTTMLHMTSPISRLLPMILRQRHHRKCLPPKVDAEWALFGAFRPRRSFNGFEHPIRISNAPSTNSNTIFWSRRKLERHQHRRNRGRDWRIRYIRRWRRAWRRFYRRLKEAEMLILCWKEMIASAFSTKPTSFRTNVRASGSCLEGHTGVSLDEALEDC